ncbi:EG45-like domain containing protein [Phalaenopsis equestris]|uniref:EG45-like domain containing protein n=1 Tax=Phalaenopsis equestris TaxID=78828 RepID=UPI0009E3EADB|nr:EG45-like domain containing protein [Phalaenopsis equestris]
MYQMNHAAVALAAAMLLCSLSPAFTAETNATFILPPYIPSACFGSKDMGNMIVGVSPACFGSKDMGNMIVGVGDSMWNNGGICGKKLSVKCIDEGSKCKSLAAIEVTVVELCRGCPDSIILSLQAFELISSQDVGVVKVDYVQ